MADGDGAVRDISFAARVQGMRGVASTQFFLPPEPNLTSCARPAGKIDEMILTGHAPRSMPAPEPGS